LMEVSDLSAGFLPRLDQAGRKDDLKHAFKTRGLHHDTSHQLHGA
jgi:hypothetical protein